MIAVHYAYDIAPGVVLQLLGSAAAGFDLNLVACQIVAELYAALEPVQLLEQAAIRVIGIGLQHMTVGADHRQHLARVVVSVLVARAVVGLGVILVGPHHLGQPPVAVIEATGHAAVFFNAAALSVKQVILNDRPAALVVGDLHQVTSLVIGEQSAVLDAACLFPVGFGNETVGCVILTQNLATGGQLDTDDVSALVVGIDSGGKAPAAVLPVNGAGLLYHPPGSVILPVENLVQPIAEAALFLCPLVETVIAILNRRAGGVTDPHQPVIPVIGEENTEDGTRSALRRLAVLIPPLLHHVAGGVIAVLCQAILHSAVD